MKTIFQAALLAAAPVLAMPTHSYAQAIAVADIQGAVQKSAAFITAMNQMKTTYAAPIATFEARSKALQAEINPLVTAFQAAQKAWCRAMLATGLKALSDLDAKSAEEMQMLDDAVDSDRKSVV